MNMKAWKGKTPRRGANGVERSIRLPPEETVSRIGNDKMREDKTKHDERDCSL